MFYHTSDLGDLYVKRPRLVVIRHRDMRRRLACQVVVDRDKVHMGRRFLVRRFLAWARLCGTRPLKALLPFAGAATICAGPAGP
jgi:hypothetical protein